jgi:phosphate transport system permease protein
MAWSAPGPPFRCAVHSWKDRNLIGQVKSIWVLANDDVDMLIKGHIDRALPENERRLKDSQLAWIDQLNADGRLRKAFNVNFFHNGDSREPELAGIRGALMGSFLHPGGDPAALFSHRCGRRPSTWKSSPPRTAGPI